MNREKINNEIEKIANILESWKKNAPFKNKRQPIYDEHGNISGYKVVETTERQKPTYSIDYLFNGEKKNYTPKTNKISTFKETIHNLIDTLNPDMVIVSISPNENRAHKGDGYNIVINENAKTIAKPMSVQMGETLLGAMNNSPLKRKVNDIEEVEEQNIDNPVMQQFAELAEMFKSSLTSVMEERINDKVESLNGFHQLELKQLSVTMEQKFELFKMQTQHTIEKLSDQLEAKKQELQKALTDYKELLSENESMVEEISELEDEVEALKEKVKKLESFDRKAEIITKNASTGLGVVFSKIVQNNPKLGEQLAGLAQSFVGGDTPAVSHTKSPKEQKLDTLNSEILQLEDNDFVKYLEVMSYMFNSDAELDPMRISQVLNLLNNSNMAIEVEIN